jgi:hypothetical protein
MSITHSPKAMKIKNALESRGWKNVTIHWEPISSPIEMCGHRGGWLADIPDYPGNIEPLGLNFNDAMNHIHNSRWLNNESKIK